jgi:5-methylcytosine-specific restriction endonuclease McrA
MPRRSSPYGGPWQQIRRQILHRDAYACQIRLPGCTVTATEVDHITSLTNGGGRLDPSNLRAACKPCNIAARNRDVAARARGESTNSPSEDWYGTGAVRCRVHGLDLTHVCPCDEDPYPVGGG